MCVFVCVCVCVCVNAINEKAHHSVIHIKAILLYNFKNRAIYILVGT